MKPEREHICVRLRVRVSEKKNENADEQNQNQFWFISSATNYYGQWRDVRVSSWIAIGVAY